MFEFIRKIEISPAYEPSHNKGRGAAYITFILKGPEGVVSFIMHTGWYLAKGFICDPSGSDLSFHSLNKMPYMQECPGPCIYLDNKPGYRYTSGILANKLVDILLKDGSDRVFEYMTAYYMEPEQILNHRSIILLPMDNIN